MRTLLPDPPPPEIAGPLEELLDRRRAWGADRHDEVWEGVLHMNPVPDWRHAELQGQLLERLRPVARSAELRFIAEINLGAKDDCRVPDGAIIRPGAGTLYHPTAALVLEVVSSGDDTYGKLPFYAARGVEEVLIVDPDARTVVWLGLSDGAYRPLKRSGLIAAGPDELTEQIEWPE